MITEWKDTPDKQGYYWVVINNELSYQLVYVNIVHKEFSKVTLAGSSITLGYGNYFSKKIEEVQARWLYVETPSEEDINSIHKNFEVYNKKNELDRLSNRMNELRVELDKLESIAENK